MSLTEIVTVQHERAKAPRQERISRRVRLAIDAMVMEGLHRAKAAAKAGIAEHTLYQAMRKSSVLAYRNSQLRVVRESAAARSVAKAEELMDSAGSESVKAEMVKWLGGLEGISPVQRTEHATHLSISVPGLQLVVMGAGMDLSDAPLIGDQPHEAGKVSARSSLPKPVPHPTMRNAQILPPESGKPRATRGEK